MIRTDSDDRVNYRRIAELANEFLQLWQRLQALYLDAAAGFVLVRESVNFEQARARSFVAGTELDSEEFQDTRRFFYDEIFVGSFVTSGMHEATQGEVKVRNTAGGANFITLGRLCIVSFYDFWNDFLRKEYAIAKGRLDRDERSEKVIERCLKLHASHDLWGDIRFLRQSIVHNRGFAISDISRAKIIKWFKPGDAIDITPDHMRSLFLVLRDYYNELYGEQFPEQSFIFPNY